MTKLNKVIIANKLMYWCKAN